MPRTLRDSIEHPTYTKAVIKQASHSPLGKLRVWCVVEAPDDVVIYQKFFDSMKVSILPSDDENGKRGCRNVESIVSELYNEESDLRLLGIRDCDYTRYDERYSAPDNVFLTDCRDIEMMMFVAPSVLQGLRDWNEEFPRNIEECAQVERYLGYLRIYNEIRQSSCRFHGNLTKVSLVWDGGIHAIKPDYRNNLFNKFKEACEGEVNKEDFENFVEEKRLEEEPYTYVCRGHDMLNLLSAMMIYREYGLAKDIRERMVNAYSDADFSATQLHAEILLWAEERNLIVFPA